MKRKIATALAALLATGGLVAGTAGAASATTEQEQPQVCYTTETHAELTWALQRSDWYPATPASIEDGWYTEADDAAPTIVDGDLVFTAPGGQAVGLRYDTSFDLSELSGESYSPVFHDRAVVDVDGTPFGTWRDDYLSLTFVSADTVYVAGVGTKTLDEAKAAYPGTVISFGFHMDSNAAAGTTYTVDGDGIVDAGSPDGYTDWYEVSTGQGLALPDGHSDGEQFQTDGLYRYVITGTVDVTEQVEVECPAQPAPGPWKQRQIGTDVVDCEAGTVTNNWEIYRVEYVWDAELQQWVESEFVVDSWTNVRDADEDECPLPTEEPTPTEEPEPTQEPTPSATPQPAALVSSTDDDDDDSDDSSLLAETGFDTAPAAWTAGAALTLALAIFGGMALFTRRARRQ